MATRRHGLAGSPALSRYLQRYLNGWLDQQREQGRPDLSQKRADDATAAGADLEDATRPKRRVRQ